MSANLSNIPFNVLPTSQKPVSGIASGLPAIRELETQIELCKRLGFLTGSDLDEMRPHVLRTRQLLAGTIRSLTARIPTRDP